jgi:hypothetical protein
LICSAALIDDHEVVRRALRDPLAIGGALLLVALGGTQRLFL